MLSGSYRTQLPQEANVNEKDGHLFGFPLEGRLIKEAWRSSILCTLETVDEHQGHSEKHPRDKSSERILCGHKANERQSSMKEPG